MMFAVTLFSGNIAMVSLPIVSQLADAAAVCCYCYSCALGLFDEAVTTHAA